MGANSDMPLDAKTFGRLQRAYRKRWKVTLMATASDGKIALGGPAADRANLAPICRHAVSEAMRWGEPTVQLAPGRRLVWAVPLMHNAACLGGLVALVSERRVFPDRSGSPAMDVRAACSELRLLAEEANLTNAALLAARRSEYDRQRMRAEAIHEIKILPYADVRQMYLRHEPALIAAIRKDERGDARGILNRLLAAIHYQAGSRLELTKSFFMELVVTMCRTAVEAGGSSEKLFGEDFASIAALSRIESEEQLAPWLHEMLERIMDSIRSQRGQSPSYMVAEAMRFLSEHFSENISRDDVARAAHISPSHFSRMIKKHLGRSFTDLLNQMRVDRAAEFLVRTDSPLSLVAFQTGFRDQSYFTKVFRRYMKLTPRQYRLRRQEGG